MFLLWNNEIFVNMYNTIIAVTNAVTAFYKVFVCPSTWRTFNYKLAIKGEEYTFIWFWFIQNIVFLY
jgi:hypothetical protein